MTIKARREPLLVRPGARFECFGDGLCCSDIHAVGALSERDCDMLSLISEDAIDRQDTGGAVMMMRSDTGRCVFWGEHGCALHAKLGPEMKPSPCIQFPYALTATPVGGRISTQHRCTCRTLGSPSPVTVEGARPCLLDSEGELKFEHAVFDEVQWSESETVSFAEYEKRESKLIEALLQGERLGAVLGAEPFPALRETTWAAVADGFLEFQGPSRVAVASRWFADALGFLVERRERTEHARPWADAFARAEARIVDPVPPNRVFGDWLADEHWSMRWTHWGSLARARAEWATRLAVARRIAGWLDIRTATRDNVAAAEAVMIVDVVSTSDPWERVLGDMLTL